MPNWKKVLISGSKAAVYDITASNLPGETSTTSDVVVLDNNGRFHTASRGDFGVELVVPIEQFSLPILQMVVQLFF